MTYAGFGYGSTPYGSGEAAAPTGPTPATVAATVTIPAPTVTVPLNATITPDAVAAVVAVPAATAQTFADDYEAAVLADTPAIYWRLGEPSGTTATDSSGNSRDGTYGGGVTLGATSLLLVGSDTAITMAGAAACTRTETVSHSGDWSLEVWFDTTGNTMLLAQATFALKLTLDASGHVVGGTNTATGSASVTTSGTFNDGDPHHAVVTYVASTNTVTLYVDGVEQGTNTTTNDISSATQFRIGTDNLSSLQYAGGLDEYAVYLSALSEARIVAHYEAAGYSVDPNAAITATTVAAVTAFPAATVGGTQNANILPSTVATLAAFPAAFVAGDDAPVSATTVAAVVAFPAPTVETITSLATTTIDDSVGGRLLLGGFALIEPIPAVPTAPSTADVRVIKRVSETYPNPTLDDGRPT